MKEKSQTQLTLESLPSRYFLDQCDCWCSKYCSGLLAKEIVRRQLFPWESEYLPMFLKGYFKYCWHFSADIDEVEHFKRRIEARYLWKDIPPEYKDTYSFVYKAAYHPLYGACALPTNPEDYALMLDLCKAIVNLQE